MKRWFSVLFAGVVVCAMGASMGSPPVASASVMSGSPIGEDPEMVAAVASAITLAANVPIIIDWAAGDGGAAPWLTVPAMVIGTATGAMGAMMSQSRNDEEQNYGILATAVGITTVVHAIVASTQWRLARPDSPESPQFHVLVDVDRRHPVQERTLSVGDTLPPSRTLSVGDTLPPSKQLTLQERTLSVGDTLPPSKQLTVLLF